MEHGSIVMRSQLVTYLDVLRIHFFLITVFYENYLNNDVKLEKIFLIDYFQNDLNMPVKAFLKVVAVS